MISWIITTSALIFPGNFLAKFVLHWEIVNDTMGVPGKWIRALVGLKKSDKAESSDKDVNVSMAFCFSLASFSSSYLFFLLSCFYFFQFSLLANIHIDFFFLFMFCSCYVLMYEPMEIVYCFGMNAIAFSFRSLNWCPMYKELYKPV